MYSASGIQRHFAKKSILFGESAVHFALFSAQDGLPMLGSVNRRPASTRLATPNKINSCAVFLATDRLAVVNHILDALVGQTKTLLGHIHARHARQANWLPASTDNLRVKRLDHLVQFAPRRDLVNLDQKAIATG
jgi:hypothetical protein